MPRWRRGAAVYAAVLATSAVVYRDGLRAAWPALRDGGLRVPACPTPAAKVAELPLRIDAPAAASEARDTLVFVHGFPDDAGMWEQQVRHFSAQYRCVRLTLPDYDGRCTSTGGYSFEEVVALLRGTLHAAAANGTLPPGPVTIVAHDWGAWVSYMWHHQHPGDVRRFVGVDVGDPEWGPLFTVVQTMYQGWLIAAWRVGGALGQAMTHMLMVFMPAPEGAHRSVTTAMNYLYSEKWSRFGWFRKTMADYTPRVPFLYLYGAAKPVQFHGESWLARIRGSHPASSVVEFENSVHWLMVDEPTRFNQAVDDFLTRSA